MCLVSCFTLVSPPTPPLELLAPSPPGLSGRSPAMPEIEQSPACFRLQLPRTSSASTSAFGCRQRVSTRFQPPIQTTRTTPNLCHGRNLEGINSSSDGALLDLHVGSSLRKHPFYHAKRLYSALTPPPPIPQLLPSNQPPYHEENNPPLKSMRVAEESTSGLGGSAERKWEDGWGWND